MSPVADEARQEAGANRARADSGLDALGQSKGEDSPLAARQRRPCRFLS